MIAATAVNNDCPNLTQAKVRIVNSRKADTGPAAVPAKAAAKSVRLGQVAPRAFPPPATPPLIHPTMPTPAPRPVAAAPQEPEQQMSDGAEVLFQRFSDVLESAQELIDKISAKADSHQPHQAQPARQRFFMMEIQRDENNRAKTLSVVETTTDADEPQGPAAE